MKLTVIKSESKMIILQRFVLNQLLCVQKDMLMNIKLPLGCAQTTKCCQKFNSVERNAPRQQYDQSRRIVFIC